MQQIINFETFLLTGILLNITPGNDTIFVLTNSINHGKKAGIVAALGIGTGSFFHTLFAAFGLSLVIANSVFLFNLIKYAGAIYICFIGFQMLKNKSSLSFNSKNSSTTYNLSKVYLDAIITNVLNPKVALFFISFLPQFIDKSAKEPALVFIILGFTFILTGTIWCLILAFFATFISVNLNTKVNYVQYINLICGIVMIFLGIKVAFFDPNN